MYAQPGSPVSPVDPTKVRLTDEQMTTLRDALKVAAAAMHGSADIARSLGDSFIASQAENRAEEFESLLTLGEGVTRVTVRL